MQLSQRSRNVYIFSHSYFYFLSRKYRIFGKKNYYLFFEKIGEPKTFFSEIFCITWNVLDQNCFADCMRDEECSGMQPNCINCIQSCAATKIIIQEKVIEIMSHRIYDSYLGFWGNFRFLALISEGNSYFLPKFRLLTTFSEMWQNFRFLTKISISDKNLDYSPKFRLLSKI